MLMVGDAPGDCEAAADNGVYYYPILVKHEEMSWRRFPGEALERLVRGTYGGAWQEQMVKTFRGALFYFIRRKMGKLAQENTGSRFKWKKPSDLCIMKAVIKAA
ncbi:hypothetical protein AAA127_16405 [Enterocloster clostridioformis]